MPKFFGFRVRPPFFSNEFDEIFLGAFFFFFFFLQNFMNLANQEVLERQNLWRTYRKMANFGDLFSFFFFLQFFFTKLAIFGYLRQTFQRSNTSWLATFIIFWKKAETYGFLLIYNLFLQTNTSRHKACSFWGIKPQQLQFFTSKSDKNRPPLPSSSHIYAYIWSILKFDHSFCRK